MWRRAAPRSAGGRRRSCRRTARPRHARTSDSTKSMHTFAPGSPMSSTTLPAMPAEVIGACSSSGSNHAASSATRSRRRVRPRRALVRRASRPVASVLVEVRALVGERSRTRRIGRRMRDLALAAVELDDGSGHDQLAAVDPGGRELVEEHRLVGEDVARDRVEVVESRTRSSSRKPAARAREHVCGVDPLDVLPRPRHLVHPLVAPRAASSARRREVVHDRIPDRARELQRTARRTGRAPAARRDRRDGRRSG